MGGNTTSLRKGDTFVLQGDDTFTILHNGTTLKFKLLADKRSVELVSADEPVTISDESLFHIITSPKTDFEEDLLKRISRADSLVFSKVILDNEDLEASLLPLQNLSKNMTKQGGTKPLVVIRVAGKGGAGSGFNINKAMRIIDDQKLDAHIMRIPDIAKKF
jgi:hypothetical protein